MSLTSTAFLSERHSLATRLMIMPFFFALSAFEAALSVQLTDGAHLLSLTFSVAFNDDKALFLTRVGVSIICAP